MTSNNSEIAMHQDLEYLARNQFWWNSDYTHAYVIRDEGHPFVRFNDGQGFVEEEWLQARKDLGLEPSEISEADEEECIQLAYERMNDESVKTSIDELRADTQKYSAYYKDVRHIEYIDVYRTVDLFGCEKHGHAISHAAKKLLLTGARTGGKDVETEVREAIDSLYRWLEMREEDKKAQS